MEMPASLYLFTISSLWVRLVDSQTIPDGRFRSGNRVSLLFIPLYLSAIGLGDAHCSIVGNRTTRPELGQS